MPVRDALPDQLALGGTAAQADLARRARTSVDVAVVLAGAVVGSDRVLLDRARGLARSAAQRRMVAIAAAHLDGDGRRVHDLARDHLADRPDSVLVAWISARTPHPPSEA